MQLLRRRLFLSHLSAFPLKKRSKFCWPFRNRIQQEKASPILYCSRAAAAPLDDLGSAVQQHDLAVQAAALSALEALATAAAPLLPPAQRRALDDAAAHAAATSAAALSRVGAEAEGSVGPALAALHLSALRLLLATVLAPAPHRPRHLAAALRLFRAGAGAAGSPALAAFSRQVRGSPAAVLDQNDAALAHRAVLHMSGA